MRWMKKSPDQTVREEQPLLNSFREQRSEQLLRTALEAMQDLQNEHAFALMIVMDADRSATTRAIDAGEAVPEEGLRFNRLVLRVGSDVNVPVLDLQPVIEEDYQKHRRGFHFRNDYHWNQYMHRLVATAIAEKVRNCAWLSSPKTQNC